MITFEFNSNIPVTAPTTSLHNLYLSSFEIQMNKKGTIIMPFVCFTLTLSLILVNPSKQLVCVVCVFLSSACKSFVVFCMPSYGTMLCIFSVVDSFFRRCTSCFTSKNKQVVVVGFLFFGKPKCAHARLNVQGVLFYLLQILCRKMLKSKRANCGTCKNACKKCMQLQIFVFLFGTQITAQPAKETRWGGMACVRNIS